MTKLRAVAVFLVTYLVYHLSLFPSTPGGDSGELLAEACHLGVAHPPGYPLFTLLSHFAMAVPFPPRLHLQNTDAAHVPQWLSLSLAVDLSPTPAWRVNHFCAVCGALAAAFLSLSVWTTIGSSSSSNVLPSLAAFLFAFSPLVWEYSVTAEVFALNNALCAISLYLTTEVVRFYLNRSRSDSSVHSPSLPSSTPLSPIPCEYILLGAFFSGLCLSNQHTSLLHVFVILLCVLLHLVVYARHAFSQVASLLLKAGFFFLLGLSPYIYLFWAGAKMRAGSWGLTGTLRGWLTHVLRAEYGTFQLGGIVGRETMLQRIAIYLRHASAESMHTVFPVIVVGAVLLLLRMRTREKHTHSRAEKANKWISTTDSQPRAGKGKVEKKTKSKQAHPVPADYLKFEKEKNTCEETQRTSENEGKENDRALCTQSALFFSLWLFYTIVWHGVFSNLPLSSPMPFAVHSRFWMQPNLYLYALMGVSIHVISQNMMRAWGALSERSVVVDGALLVLLLTLLVSSRFPLLDKSALGWLTHWYGSQSLSALPTGSHSLLLAHTDLDWNAMRYLRVCEPERHSESRVDHVSLQMMPYPWFSITQPPHLPHFRIPDLNIPNLSTNREAESNAVLISRVLSGNQAYYGDNIFLDMQAVSETEISDMGLWRDFTLVPWGSQYRVLSNKDIFVSTIAAPSVNKKARERTLVRNMTKIEHWQVRSWQTLQEFKKPFPVVNARLLEMFPLGSWESAVLNVFHDAHYQLALFLLTYAIEKQRTSLSLETLPILLDRYLAAKTLLHDTWSVVKTMHTISSSERDLLKNAALAMMRVHTVLSVAVQYQDKLRQVIVLQKKAREKMCLALDAVEEALSDGGRREILLQAESVINDFVENHPTDPDVFVFSGVLRQIREQLS